MPTEDRPFAPGARLVDDKVPLWLRDWVSVHGIHGLDGLFTGHYGPLGQLDAITCPCGEQIRRPYAPVDPHERR
jgi:hypothetical protein